MEMRSTQMSENRELTEQIKSFYEIYHQKRNRPLDNWLTDVYWQALFGNVLEVGAGTRPLQSNSKVDAYVPFDIAYYAIAKAKEQNLHGIVGDATRMPFKAQSYDVVCCYDVLEHIPDPEALLAEMCRVSRQRVIVSGPNYIGRVYCPSFGRYLPRNLWLYLTGQNKHWYRLENYHLEYNDEWQPDFDAVTATNSSWVKKQLQKHGFKNIVALTWKRDMVKFSPIMDRIPAIRELGPYMHIVAER